MNEDSGYKLDLMSILREMEEEKEISKILRFYSADEENDIEENKPNKNLYLHEFYAES